MTSHYKMKLGTLCLATVSASTSVEDIPVIIIGDKSYKNHKVYMCLFPNLVIAGIHTLLLKDITVK